jgi:hypothetical protein
LKTPIAFIIFNRPDTARRVFEEIRKAQPPLLLLVADGPRPGHAHDAEQCARTRAIVDQVDWQCEIRKNYSDINLGCKKRVASGLDWVFSEVEEVIILEDDCLPHPTFFQFCEELLQKYRNDERIGHIGGSNLQFGRQRGPYSYYFSRYIHVWGWASWRRAWEGYDPDLALWPKAREEKRLQQFLGVLSLVGYWTNIFEKVYQNEIDTWDYQWSFHCWAQGRLVIIPNVNLISNIGYGADATHLIGQSIFGNMKTEAMQFPLAHPPLFLRDSAADKYTEKYHFFSPSPALRILLRLRYSFLMCLWALAKRLGVNLHTDGRLLHLFTGKKISKEYSKARR